MVLYLKLDVLERSAFYSVNYVVGHGKVYRLKQANQLVLYRCYICICFMM